MPSTSTLDWAKPAIQKLIQESKSLRACLEQLVPKQGWRKQLRWRLSIRMGILFRAVLIGLYLDPSKPLASSLISAASVCPPAVAPLRKVLKDDLGRLNEIRRALWRNQSPLRDA